MDSPKEQQSMFLEQKKERSSAFLVTEASGRVGVMEPEVSRGLDPPGPRGHALVGSRELW